MVSQRDLFETVVQQLRVTSNFTYAVKKSKLFDFTRLQRICIHVTTGQDYAVPHW